MREKSHFTLDDYSGDDGDNEISLSLTGKLSFSVWCPLDYHQLNAPLIACP